MTIREKINEYITKFNDIKGKENEISNQILNIIDDEGLELNEWREDTGIEQCSKEMILKCIELEADFDCLIIAILFMLEDQRLSLLGNGWLDDDELSRKIILKIYSSTNGKIQSFRYQNAYQIAKH